MARASSSTTSASPRDGTGEDATPAQEVVDEIKALGGEAVANYDDVSDFDGAKRARADRRSRRSARLDVSSTTPASCATGCSST